MIVPIKQWTMVRPLVVASRARRVQKSLTTEVSETKPKEGFFVQFAKMWEHQADIALRNIDRD